MRSQARIAMGVVSHSGVSSASGAEAAFVLGGPIRRLLELRVQLLSAGGALDLSTEVLPSRKRGQLRAVAAEADGPVSSYPIRPKAERHTTQGKSTVRGRGGRFGRRGDMAGTKAYERSG